MGGFYELQTKEKKHNQVKAVLKQRARCQTKYTKELGGGFRQEAGG